MKLHFQILSLGQPCLQNFSPAVSAAVFLCDPILTVPPDVHGGEDEHHQHSRAAEEGQGGNALLLGLEDKLKTNWSLEGLGRLHLVKTISLCMLMSSVDPID